MKHAATSMTLALFSLGALASTASGCSSGESIPEQLGVIDQQLVLKHYDRRKEEYGKLEIHVAALQKDLDPKAQELRRQKVAYEENRPTMTAGQRTTRKEEIQSLQNEYEIQLTDFQEMVDNQERLILDSIKQDVDDACAQFFGGA